MSHPTLGTVTAASLPSSLAGVTAWITPVSTTPSGLVFMVVAELADRGVRYKVDATITVGDGEPARIGGATSSDSRRSMTQFWYPLPPDLSLDDHEVTINVYEDKGNGPTNPSLVQAFTLGP